MPRRGRLLGADPREIPADLLRHLPLRTALAAAVRGRRHAGHAGPVGRPPHVELAAAGDLGHRLVYHLPADVPPDPYPPPPEPYPGPSRLAALPCPAPRHPPPRPQSPLSR